MVAGVSPDASRAAGRTGNPFDDASDRVFAGAALHFAAEGLINVARLECAGLNGIANMPLG
jgi:hypothetical protein